MPSFKGGGFQQEGAGLGPTQPPSLAPRPVHTAPETFSAQGRQRWAPILGTEHVRDGMPQLSSERPRAAGVAAAPSPRPLRWRRDGMSACPLSQARGSGGGRRFYQALSPFLREADVKGDRGVEFSPRVRRGLAQRPGRTGPPYRLAPPAGEVGGPRLCRASLLERPSPSPQSWHDTETVGDPSTAPGAQVQWSYPRPRF